MPGYPESEAVLCWLFGRRPEPQQQQDLLEQALAEEMAKAARRSGQGASKGAQVQFKQVMLPVSVHQQVFRQS